MMAFAQARGLFRNLFGWSPSQHAVLRMVDATGEQARPFLKQAGPPENDGEILVLEADGKGRVRDLEPRACPTNEAARGEGEQRPPWAPLAPPCEFAAEAVAGEDVEEGEGRGRLRDLHAQTRRERQA